MLYFCDTFIFLKDSKKIETFKKFTIFRNVEETSINFIALLKINFVKKSKL